MNELRMALTLLALMLGLVGGFLLMVAGSAPVQPLPYPQPTLTAPAVHR